MVVLLTNDDGYGAAGLEVLAKTLACVHEVWVVAPDRDRSGVRGFRQIVLMWELKSLWVKHPMR